MISVWRVLIPVAVVAALAGCSYGSNAEDTASAGSQPARCPAAWKPGWQRLANRIDAPVYCPSWMPSPLDAADRRPVDQRRPGRRAVTAAT